MVAKFWVGRERFTPLADTAPMGVETLGFSFRGYPVELLRKLTTQNLWMEKGRGAC